MMKLTFPRCLCNCRKHLGVLFLFITVISYSQSFEKDNPIVSTSVYITDDISSTKIESTDSNKNTIIEKGKIYIVGGMQIYGIDNFHNYRLYRKKALYKTKYIQPKKLVAKRKETIIIKNKLPDVNINTLKSKYAFSTVSGHSELATLSNQVISKYHVTSTYFYLLFHCLDIVAIDFLHNASPINRKVLFSYSRPPPSILIL